MIAHDELRRMWEGGAMHILRYYLTKGLEELRKGTKIFK
jgi:hypothetical protein